MSLEGYKPPLVFADISNAPIGKGDFITFRDVKDEGGKRTEHQHTVEVLALLQEIKRVRRFRIKIIESTNESWTLGAEHEIGLKRDLVIQGAIVRAQDYGRRYEQHEADKIAAFQLRNYLDSLPAERGKKPNQTTFDAALTYLRRTRVFPQSETEDQAKVHLRNVVKAHPDVLWSRGGYVGSMRGEFILPASTIDVPGLDKRRYVEVDWLKLVTGIRLILEAFSIFRLKNLE